MLLLQADTLAAESYELQDEITLIGLLMKGGFIMIPLALLGAAAIFIFIERYLNISRASRNPDQLFEQVKAAVLEGNLQKARAICAREDNPISRMLDRGIGKLGFDMKSIEATIENAGKLEIYRLEKNLGILATISGAAPMLGFFGTVTGMISAFIAIAQQEGAVSPKMLSSGIYEAMITTAAGLFVGIIAYVGYNYLVTRIQKVIYNMELTTLEFIELLERPHVR
ncbi:MAG: MotA/TolQ/ExbB proton channel family protein [Cytophagales bacterium]|nr:MotA/TolQ/ExbB proton channel family protein [Bernardetiaceae bacterium]MDW8210598.1 MotA/TolQ/ExbB proton channel family protein [Cytophagales bacterium]